MHDGVGWWCYAQGAAEKLKANQVTEQGVLGLGAKRISDLDNLHKERCQDNKPITRSVVTRKQIQNYHVSKVEDQHR